MSDPNAPVIAEFRAHGGVVAHAMGGALAHLDLVVLHHVGRRSGTAYESPVSWMPHGDGYLLLGSFAGSPVEPRWVANVEAMGELTAEFGTHTERVTATVLRDGPEWERLYPIAVAHWPFVRHYETRTTRAFPIILLTPAVENS